MRKLIGIARMSPHMLPKVLVKPSPELPEPLINKFLLTHNPVTDGKRREKESGMLKATKQYGLARIERYRRNAWGRFMMVVCTAANIIMAAITGYWLYNAYQGIANHDATIMKPLAALHGPVLGVGASGQNMAIWAYIISPSNSLACCLSGYVWQSSRDCSPT